MIKVYFFIHVIVQCRLVRLKEGPLLRAVFEDSNSFHSVTLPRGSLPDLAPGHQQGREEAWEIRQDVSEAGLEGSRNTSVHIH